MEFTLQYKGEDDWNREVFRNPETGRYFKRYKNENTFYTANGFYGEPDIPLKAEVKVTIIDYPQALEK